MPRLSDLSDTQRNKIIMRPVRINDSTPWTSLDKPLSQSKLAIVTTAGLHLRDDKPFVKYDQTFRVIPSASAESDILQSQSSIGFDRSLRMRDLNVVFPLDRLRELTAQGVIGELAADFYSMVGAQEDSESTAAKIGPEIASLLRRDSVDVALITPTCPVCTHTGAELQRELEEAGLATVSISLVREYTEKVRPPRALLVPFPFGAPVGTPGDRAQQAAVLTAALSLLDAEEGPVLADFETDTMPDVSPGPVQASGVTLSGQPEMDAATEASMMRRHYEQWYERTGKTAVGLTKIPVVRFRGIVRFFEAYLTNDDADMGVRPADVSRADWIRYCADDLKAMYLQGRIAMKPNESPTDAGRWLWAETALGILLVQLRDRMQASDDEAIREAAYGVAR